MDKMDTQGMSREMTPEEKEKWEKSGRKQVHKPMMIPTGERSIKHTQVTKKHLSC